MKTPIKIGVWTILAGGLLILQAATAHDAGFIDGFDGKPEHYTLQRGDEIVQVAMYTILKVGDVIIVKQKPYRITLMLQGGTQSVVVTHDNSPFKITQKDKVPGVLVKSWKSVKKSWEYFYKPAPLSEQVPTGIGKGSPETFAMPLLNNRYTKLIAGKRAIYLQWQGDKPPYQLEIKQRQNSLWKSLWKLENLDKSWVKTKTLNFDTGRYRVIVKNAEGQKIRRGFRAVPPEQLPLVPRELQTAPLLKKNRNLYQAAWLAAYKGGKWKFEAYQHYQQLLSNKQSSLEQIIQLNQEGKQAYNTANYLTALKKWEQGLPLARQAKHQQAIGVFLGNIGMVYDNLGQYQTALDYYQQVLVIHQEIGDRHGKGFALSNIGVVYLNLGQYQTALDYHQQALVIHQEIGDKYGEGSDFGNLGNVYLKLRQYQIALNYYRQALAIHQKIGDRRGEGSTLSNIGAVYLNLGQYQTALGYYQQALAIDHEIADRRGARNNLTNLGVVYSHFGQSQIALDYFQKALAIDREIGDRRGEGSDLGNLGNVYQNLGQYQTALDFFQQALAIHQEIGDRRGEGTALSNLGVVYQKLGQSQIALDYYQQALEIRREIGDRRGESADLSNIGVVHRSFGQYQTALDYYQQALKIKREINDKRGEGADLTNIGMVYDDLKQYQTALDYYQQALFIRRDIGDRRGVGSNLTNIGVVYQNLGVYQKAKKAFQNSASILETINSDDLWIAQRGLAFTEAKLKQFELAIQHYEQSIDNLEKRRASLIEKEHKTSFMSDKLYVYDELIALLQSLHSSQPQRGYDRKALEISKRKQ
jgi:tetratricopeptide (TPR) repeat protein